MSIVECQNFVSSLGQVRDHVNQSFAPPRVIASRLNSEYNVMLMVMNWGALLTAIKLGCGCGAALRQWQREVSKDCQVSYGCGQRSSLTVGPSSGGPPRAHCSIHYEPRNITPSLPGKPAANLYCVI